MTAHDIVGRVLAEAGLLQPIHLGAEDPAHAAHKLTREHVTRLEAQLAQQQAENHTLITVVLAMYCVVFMAAGWVILRATGDAWRLGALIGSGVSLAGVAARVATLWREKVLIGAILVVIENMSSDEAAEVLLALYFDRRDGVNSPRKHARRRIPRKNTDPGTSGAAASRAESDVSHSR